MPRETSARYKEVQGLSRGLEVLRAMNHGRGGEFGIADVAARTGLHRTTVRRLVETLYSKCYVRRSPSDNTFRLALRVRELSEGFTDDEWIAEVAPPVFGKLLRQVVWPTDLCTFDGDAMVIRETTHRFSPLSFHRSMVGVHLPMLFTATGRACLAFCSDAECNDILRLLMAGSDAQADLARWPKSIATLLKRTLAAGYGANDREWAQEPKVAAIALPVRHAGRVLGSLNIVFMASALSVPQAAHRYLGSLRAAVQRIEQSLARTTV